MRVTITLSEQQTTNMQDHIQRSWDEFFERMKGSTREQMVADGALLPGVLIPVSPERLTGNCSCELDAATGQYSFTGKRSDFSLSGHKELLVAAVFGQEYAPYASNKQAGNLDLEVQAALHESQRQQAFALLEAQVVEHATTHPHLPFHHTYDDQVASHDISTREGFLACMEAIANFPHEMRLDRFRLSGADWGADYRQVASRVKEMADQCEGNLAYAVVKSTVEQAAMQPSQRVQAHPADAVIAGLDLSDATNLKLSALLLARAMPQDLMHQRLSNMGQDWGAPYPRFCEALTSLPEQALHQLPDAEFEAYSHLSWAAGAGSLDSSQHATHKAASRPAFAPGM